MVFFTWSERYLRDATIEEQLLEVSSVESMRYGRCVICIQPRRILRDLSMYRAARATLLVNCKPFSSRHWAVYRLLIPCQYRMRGSPYFKGEICLWAFSAGLLPSRPKFLIFRIHVSVQYFLQLMVILLSIDVESHVDLEAAYAPARCVSSCPSTRVRVELL
jgi:hypothetical protein